MRVQMFRVRDQKDWPTGTLGPGGGTGGGWLPSTSDTHRKETSRAGPAVQTGGAGTVSGGIKDRLQNDCGEETQHGRQDAAQLAL